jgi:Phosphate-selective porin O and P
MIVTRFRSFAGHGMGSAALLFGCFAIVSTAGIQAEPGPARVASASSTPKAPDQSRVPPSSGTRIEISQLERLILNQNAAIEDLKAKVERQQSLIDKLIDSLLIRQGQGTDQGPHSPPSAAAAAPAGAFKSLASMSSPSAQAANTSSQGTASQTPENGTAVTVKTAEPIAPVVAALISPATLAAANQKTPAPANLPPATSAVTPAKTKSETPSPTRKWFEKYSLRGYAQFRYNRLLETNPLLSCEQCDRSWGNNGAFLVRRARLILSGDISDRVFMYIQPDLASAAGTTNHYAQLRDLYFDVALDKKKEFRIRVGQSKVPFGFENLQSSQNRPSLDRSDALNSAVANERDLGAFFYWAPAHIRKRFSHLVSSGLKGSGDYGVFGAGLYNGQTANRPEANNNLHTVARLTYPFELKNGQFIEAGIGGYTGQYSVGRDQRNAGTQGPEIFPDRRVAGSFVLYPQPFGFQAEYNAGRGPMFNRATSRIENRGLKGGYGQFMYMAKFRGQVLTPYIKAGYYDGGKKHELDARRYLVREQEFGVEWQPNPYIELTTAYTHSDRTFEDLLRLDPRQEGNLMRIQLQFNY